MENSGTRKGCFSSYYCCQIVLEVVVRNSNPREESNRATNRKEVKVSLKLKSSLESYIAKW